MQPSTERTLRPAPRKSDLRKTVLAARNALPPEQIAAMSRAAEGRLFSLPEFAQARWVMFFITFGSEIDTLPMVRRALAERKRVVAPRTEAQTRGLVPCEIGDPGQELARSAYGIPEPTVTCPAVALELIDVVLVPAAVWAEDGYRIGYGAGYYDRFLSRLVRACRIGLGLELQVVPTVPHRDHDLPVDILVTDARVRRFSHRSDNIG